MMWQRWRRSRQGTIASRTGEWRHWSVRACTEVVPVLEWVSRALREAGYSPREGFGIRLALEEALVNAIKHGHRDDPSKEVRVRCRVAPASFLAQVKDEGPGFNPREVPDPLSPECRDRAGGRGLLLMRRYMTSVHYNHTGTCVTLCKRRG